MGFPRISHTPSLAPESFPQRLKPLILSGLNVRAKACTLHIRPKKVLLNKLLKIALYQPRQRVFPQPVKPCPSVREAPFDFLSRIGLVQVRFGKKQFETALIFFGPVGLVWVARRKKYFGVISWVLIGNTRGNSVRPRTGWGKAVEVSRPV
jgi:hypothetical protein